MPSIESNSVRRWAAAAGIIALHSTLVPLAIGATLAAYGYENGLTPRNQATWGWIIAAQLTLLALVLSLGPGSLLTRLTVYIAGTLLVLLSVVWAYSMLSDFPEPAFSVWIGQLKLNSVWVVLPPLATAVLLLGARPFAAVKLANDDPGAFRFRVLDLLAVMAFVAALTAWFKYVLTPETRALFAGGFTSHLATTPVSAAMALGAWRIAAPGRGRLWGVLLLVGATAVTLAMQVQAIATPGASPFTWIMRWSIRWALVIGTLCALRRWVWRPSTAIAPAACDREPLPPSTDCP